MGTCLVSYDGFGSNWDEWVKGSRIRPAASPVSTVTRGTAAGNQAARASAQPESGNPLSVPVGTYNCYTFDNGQLNYAFNDVVIRPDGRYSVGKSAGTFAVGAGGAMTFTGTMANAQGQFAIKSSGKPQIDLVFNGDPRASMSCPRAG